MKKKIKKKASHTTAIRALIHAIPKQNSNHHLHTTTDCGTAQCSGQHSLDLCTSNCWCCSTSHSPDVRQLYLKRNALPCHAPYYKLVTSSHSHKECRKRASEGQNSRLHCHLFLKQWVIHSGWKFQTETYCTCRTSKLNNLVLAWPSSGNTGGESRKQANLQPWKLIPTPLKHQGNDPLVNNAL